MTYQSDCLIGGRHRTGSWNGSWNGGAESPSVLGAAVALLCGIGAASGRKARESASRNAPLVGFG